MSILGDRQLLFVVSPSSRLPGFTCLPLCSTQASIFDITNHGVQISFLRFGIPQDLDFKIFPFFLRLKRRQNSLPENCKSQMKKPSPLWRPRVTFLSTPVLLLLGKEYLVAKLRIDIMRSLLGTKCSLAEGENLFCLLHLTPSAHE